MSIMIICLLLIAGLKRTKAVIFLVVIAGFLLGFSRGAAMQTSLHGYDNYYGTQVSIQGTISEDVTTESGGELRMQLKHVRIDDTPLPGTIWVSTQSVADIKRSDRVSLRGLLQKGFGNLPASVFRAQIDKVERPQHGDIGREFRDWFAEGVRRAIGEPEASLGVGYLVGQRSTLPQTLDEQLRLLGLTHIVVASGYNLTILVRFARRSLEKTSKYLATVSAAAMITSFVLITGFSPSMTRAALVTGLCLAAWYFGRKVQPLVILPFAAAITAYINPAFVWGDIGWYLSFAAFGGIMILAPLLKAYFWGKNTNINSLSQIFIETFSAQLATLPIIALIFGQYSLLALPANMLILPLVPLAMLITFVAGVGGILVPSLADTLGLPAQIVLQYMTGAVNLLASIPEAASSLTFGNYWLAFCYVSLVLTIVWLWRKTKINFNSNNIVD